MNKIFKYFERIGISLSVLLNTLLGGYSNQTFSARNWARKREGKRNLVFFIDKLFFWDPNHCADAWTYWVIRKDLR